MSFIRTTAIIGGAAVVAFVWKVVWPWVFGGQFKNIPGPRRKSWWRGNYGAIFERDSWDYHRNLWESYGGCFKIYGLFGDEQLYLTDPQAVTQALCKETENVTVTDLVLTSNMAIFGPGMTSTSGDLHKKQRKVVNPVFSGQHMKATTPLFYPPTYELMNVIEDLVKDGPAEVDWMKYLSLGTLEFLGRVGLGHSFGTLDMKKKSEYHTAVSAITGVALDIAVLSLFMPILTALLPGWVRQKIVDWTPWPSLQRMNHITKVMDKTSRDIFYSKKEALARGESLMDKDILNVLMQSNNAADEEDRLPDEQIIGQLSAIIFAGNDTTSVMLSRLLHNLAMRQDVQQKLREEVIEARLNYGDMDWDQLNSLPYMEAVVKELFRRFPSVPFLTRTVRKPIVLKLGTPIKGVDGRMIDTIPIKANTDLIISVMGMNRQTCVWGKDADDFKPERWLKSMPESYTKANIPGVFPGLLTFMAGRKACPGFKFAEIEIKLLISLVMERFQFDLSDNDHNVLWCIGHLSKPQVLNNEDFNTPSLPLKVTLIKKTQ